MGGCVMINTKIIKSHECDDHSYVLYSEQDCHRGSWCLNWFEHTGWKSASLRLGFSSSKLSTVQNVLVGDGEERSQESLVWDKSRPLHCCCLHDTFVLIWNFKNGGLKQVSTVFEVSESSGREQHHALSIHSDMLVFSKLLYGATPTYSVTSECVIRIFVNRL